MHIRMLIGSSLCCQVDTKLLCTLMQMTAPKQYNNGIGRPNNTSVLVGKLSTISDVSKSRYNRNSLRYSLVS